MQSSGRYAHKIEQTKGACIVKNRNAASVPPTFLILLLVNVYHVSPSAVSSGSSWTHISKHDFCLKTSSNKIIVTRSISVYLCFEKSAVGLNLGANYTTIRLLCRVCGFTRTCWLTAFFCMATFAFLLNRRMYSRGRRGVLEFSSRVTLHYTNARSEWHRE